MENIIFEVSLHTDYETTIKLLQLYTKILNRYNNIWKMKCEKQFSDKPYFDNWTGAENYLMCTKQKFLLVLHNIDNYSCNKPYLYEYDKITKYVHNNAKLCDCDYDTALKSIFLYPKYCRFIIITQFGYGSSFINCFNSLDECIEWIKSCNTPNFWNQRNIYIIDINKMIPIFHGKKNRKCNNSTQNQFIFCYKYVDNNLKQLLPESYGLI